MLLPCTRCGDPVPQQALFCPGCGHASPAPAAAAAPAAIPELPPVRLAIDGDAMRHFLVGTRCALRFRLDAVPSDLRAVAIHAQLIDGERLNPARLEIGIGSGSALAPEGLLTLWLVPTLAGFYELRGLVICELATGADSASTLVRRYARFDGLQFRVGTPAEGQRVSVVNIDQRSARVVDNSRTSFTAPSDGPDTGGLVQRGEFHDVPLVMIPRDQAAALFPDVIAAEPPPPAPPSPAPNPSALSPVRGGPVNFLVKAERGEYQVTGVLCQGDLATIYEGRRVSDGANVAVKLTEDEADNDLMATEVATLALLTAENSPQRKHLPTVLDRFHTRDHRIGTVFERLDGLDLTEVRRRLPGGLPPRHMYWVMRRCLSVLGYAHSRGVLHGNVDPSHILIRPRDHNVWLVDWCYAIVNPARTGKGFVCLNDTYSPPEVAARQPPLPSSDLYALGKCMFFALGGDPGQKRLPDGLDERLARFLQYFVLESPLSRAQDAWESYRFLNHLRADIWGKHEFVELIL